MRLTDPQKRALRRLQAGGGKTSAHPDHWHHQAASTIRALLARGLITYRDDPCYLLHKYLLTDAGRAAIARLG